MGYNVLGALERPGPLDSNALKNILKSDKHSQSHSPKRQRRRLQRGSQILLLTGTYFIHTLYTPSPGGSVTIGALLGEIGAKKRGHLRLWKSARSALKKVTIRGLRPQVRL